MNEKIKEVRKKEEKPIEVKSWLIDVIKEKEQAFKLILKLCAGFITDRIRNNISEIEVLQGIEQIKNQIYHELMEFGQMESEAYFIAERIEELDPGSRKESISVGNEKDLPF